MSLQSVLEQIGLSKKETATYLAVLELGQASALRIAHKAGIKRPTTYVTLASLQGKKLVHAIPKGSTTLFEATDPERILNTLNEQTMAFRQILPELRSILNAVPNKPKVRFYEGKKNINALYLDEIFHTKEIIGITSMATLRTIFSHEEILAFIRAMASHGTRMRELLDGSSEAHLYAQEKERVTGHRDAKILPPAMHFPIDLLIYNNRVALISFKNLIAVVIEDGTIAHAQTLLLEFLWNSLPDFAS